MTVCRFCILLLLLLSAVPVYAEQYHVVAVSDGDTITVEPMQGGDRVKVRLHGIDAPELRQPYGQAAKAFVVKTVLYKNVDVQSTPQGTDRYRRIVAIVDVPNIGILQELLLDAGLAWVYPRFCKDCDSWEVIQAQSIRQRKGLWIENNPIEPWEWRKKR